MNTKMVPDREEARLRVHEDCLLRMTQWSLDGRRIVDLAEKPARMSHLVGIQLVGFVRIAPPSCQQRPHGRALHWHGGEGSANRTADESTPVYMAYLPHCCLGSRHAAAMTQQTDRFGAGSLLQGSCENASWCAPALEPLSIQGGAGHSSGVLGRSQQVCNNDEECPAEVDWRYRTSPAATLSMLVL